LFHHPASHAKEIEAPDKLVLIDAFSDKDGGLGRHMKGPDGSPFSEPMPMGG
jgi:hypothetical protein